MADGLDRTKLVLLVSAALAPFAGILGTIISLKYAFDETSGAEVVDPEDFSLSMSRALMWTLAGIAVGVVLFIVWIVVRRRGPAHPDSISDE